MDGPFSRRGEGPGSGPRKSAFPVRGFIPRRGAVPLQGGAPLRMPSPRVEVSQYGVPVSEEAVEAVAFQGRFPGGLAAAPGLFGVAKELFGTPEQFPDVG